MLPSSLPAQAGPHRHRDYKANAAFAWQVDCCSPQLRAFSTAADGVAKNRTSIAAGAFIGSNSTLVAPVTVGEKALIAAGSVITTDVPADALAFGRSRQTIKEHRADATRDKLRAEHERKAS